jgi:hypothetical protein
MNGIYRSDGVFESNAGYDTKLTEKGQENKGKLRTKLVKARNAYCNELECFHKAPPFTYVRAKRSVDYYTKQVEECPLTRERRIDIAKKDLDDEKTKRKIKYEEELQALNRKYDEYNEKAQRKYDSEVADIIANENRVKTTMEQKLEEVNKTFEEQKQFKPKSLLKAELNFNSLVEEWNSNMYFGKCPITLPSFYKSHTTPLEEVIRESEEVSEEEQKKVEHEKWVVEERKRIEDEEKRLRSVCAEDKARIERERERVEKEARDRAFTITEAERVRKEQEDMKRQREMRELELNNPEEYKKKYLEPVKVEYFEEEDEEDDFTPEEIEEAKRKLRETYKKPVIVEKKVIQNDKPSITSLKELEALEEELKQLRKESIEKDRIIKEQPFNPVINNNPYGNIISNTKIPKKTVPKRF